MTPLETLRAIAADPLHRKTAREILSARLSQFRHGNSHIDTQRDLGPIRDMPADTRRALYELAKGLVANRLREKGGDA